VVVVGYDLAQGHNSYIVSTFHSLFGASGPGAGGVPAFHVVPGSQIARESSEFLFSSSQFTPSDLDAALRASRHAVLIASGSYSPLITDSEFRGVVAALREVLSYHNSHGSLSTYLSPELFRSLSTSDRVYFISLCQGICEGLTLPPHVTAGLPL